MGAGRQRVLRGSGRTGRRAVVTVAAAVLALVTVACLPADGPEPTPGPTAAGPTATQPSAEPAGTPPAPEPTSPAPPPTTSPPATRAPTSPAPTAAPTTPAPPPAPPTTSPPPGPLPTTPAPAVWTVPAQWRGIDVEVLPTSRPVVALTFDGGASDAAVTSVLATLDRYDVPATFFVTGAFASSYPGAVRAMAAGGHPVGNHSDTHPSFPDSTNVVIREELARAEASIAPLTGRTTHPLFRFPFGARTDLDIDVVNAAGYIPFRWTVDTLGWKGTDPGGITADVVVDRVLDTARAGQIVLMHVGANPDDGTTLDADALPRIIEGLRDMGYGFVTLRELVS